MVRIVAGLVFISYGTMKVLGYPPSPVPIPAFDPRTLLGVAGLLEMAGGTLIVLGLFTRPVALVLSGEMAVAYLRTHFPVSPFPTVNQGIPALLYCLLFLYLTFAGAGVWSLDALITRRKWVERKRAERRAPDLDLGLPRPPRAAPRAAPQLHPPRPVLHRH